MKTLLHKAEERGEGEHGWLTTRYSFSFADWLEPSRMGFGKLRVLNDDRVAPGTGFGAHAHKDMEIITIVTRGTVSHADNMGNREEVKAGEVQVMSAGTGVVHSEKNESLTEPLELFQIWITPNEAGVVPRYEQKGFDFAKPGITNLVGDGALSINQDAEISYLNLVDGMPITYELTKEGHAAYLFVIEGAIIAAGHTLFDRDALGVWATGQILLQGAPQARLLIIEVPF